MKNLSYFLFTSILTLIFGCSKESISLEKEIFESNRGGGGISHENSDYEYYSNTIDQINKKLWTPQNTPTEAIASFLEESISRNSNLKSLEEAIWFVEGTVNYNHATNPNLKLRILPSLQINGTQEINAAELQDSLPYFEDSVLLTTIQQIEDQISPVLNDPNVHHFLTEIELIDIDPAVPNIELRYAVFIAEAYLDPCGLDQTDHWYNSNRTSSTNPRGKCNGFPNTTWPGFTASWRVADVILQNESVFGCYTAPSCPIDWPVFHTNVHHENVSGLPGQNGLTHRPALYLDSWNGSTYSCVPPFGTSTYTLNKWVSNYTTDSYQVLSDFNSNNNANHEWASLAIDYANSATNLIQFHWGTYRFGVINCKPTDD